VLEEKKSRKLPALVGGKVWRLPPVWVLEGGIEVHPSNPNLKIRKRKGVGKKWRIIR